MKKFGLIFLILFLIATGVFFYQQEKEARYSGQTFIPERSGDVPLYDGLKPDGNPEYLISGNHWGEILEFYKTVLPENGWTAVYIQSDDNPRVDGSGFMSRWRKQGIEKELWIGGGYFQNSNVTEIIFDMHDKVTASKWIEYLPAALCINEQPERSGDCYEITDRSTILQIVSMINEATDQLDEHPSFDGKAQINMEGLTIDVHYDLNKGIQFISDKGTKFMKPERKFFELTRISKEY